MDIIYEILGIIILLSIFAIPILIKQIIDLIKEIKED